MQLDNQLEDDATNENHLHDLARAAANSIISHNDETGNREQHFTAEQVNSGLFENRLAGRVNAKVLDDKIKAFEEKCINPKEAVNGMDETLFKKIVSIKSVKHYLTCVKSEKMLVKAGTKLFNSRENIDSEDVKKKLKDDTEIKCMICNEELEKDGTFFEDLPLILVDENPECNSLNIFHTSCLKRGIANSKQDLSSAVKFEDLENCWIENTILQSMSILKCLTCPSPVTDIFASLNKKERKHKEFSVNKHEMLCLFCLESGVDLTHVKQCATFGITQKSKSEVNCQVLATIDSYYALTDISTEEFVELFRLQKKIKATDSDHFFQLTFEEKAINFSIGETNFSFKASDVGLILKSLFRIVTVVKQYLMGGKNEDDFQLMKENCTFLICSLIRNNRTILHDINCKTGGLCLSGIDSSQVKKLIKNGCLIVQSIIVQRIELLDCIEKENPTVEVREKKKRNAKVMNSLAAKFNSTNFSKGPQMIELEKFDFRRAAEINDLLSNKVEKFEKTIAKLYKKRKSDETLNGSVPKIQKKNQPHLF